MRVLFIPLALFGGAVLAAHGAPYAAVNFLFGMAIVAVAMR